jgi:hypothetical protein
VLPLDTQLAAQLDVVGVGVEEVLGEVVGGSQGPGRFLMGEVPLQGNAILPRALNVVGVGVEEVLGQVVDWVVGSHLPFGESPC